MYHAINSHFPSKFTIFCLGETANDQKMYYHRQLFDEVDENRDGRIDFVSHLFFCVSAIEFLLLSDINILFLKV